MAEESLKNKTVKGVAWSGIDNVAQFGVSFIVSLVLARLLTPDDYGLIGILAIFTAVCTAIINGGFTNALIRKKACTDDDYSTVFIVNISVGLLLYAIIFICAPFIATFFEREELVLLTRVSSLVIIVGALALIPQTILTKKLDFRTQTKVTIIGSVMSGTIGIGMALLGWGVWSLVAQSLSSQLIRTALLWFFIQWVPNLRFSMESLKDLFGFGWKVMAVSIIDTVWKELNQVVVGKFYNPATLGQYTRSNQFSQLFSSNLSGVIQRVTFPVLSDIQDNKERMLSAYRRIIKMTMFITAVMMFAVGSVSEPLLYCLIGSQWYDASTYLPLLCISGSLYPLHSINLNMLQVQGRSDLLLGLEIVKKTIFIVPLVIGATVGILPMLWSSILVNIICFFLNSYYSGKLIGYSSWMQIKDITPYYCVAIAISLSVWFLKYLPISNWIILPLQIIVGIGVFFSICIGGKIKEYEEMKKLVMPFILKNKER